MGPMLFFFVLFFTLWLAVSATASEFTGQVVSVLDGDTIEVLHKKRPERIRLSGIDCAEKRQRFAQEAKAAASALVLGKDVAVRAHGKGKNWRKVAGVLLTDGTKVSQAWVG